MCHPMPIYVFVILYQKVIKKHIKYIKQNVTIFFTFYYQFLEKLYISQIKIFINLFTRLFFDILSSRYNKFRKLK